MFFPPHVPASGEPRRGVILLVVIAMLTIFAAAGVAFVYYADSEAAASKNFREASILRPPDVDPELLLSFFLQQLICDVLDDESGVYSALRGHSLRRTMWGMHYNVGTDGSITLGNNTVPWNGTGRLHFTYAPNVPIIGGQDDFNLVHYGYFPEDRILRDPERVPLQFDATGKAKVPPRTGLRAPGALDNRGLFTGGFNAPYTYADLNNMAVAAIKADGTVLTPSFFRSWNGFGLLDPGNPNWNDKTKAWLKYMVLRPRPADHPAMMVNGVQKQGFPAPEDANGDVQNAIGWTKGNDSIWLNLGAPIITLPDGRRIQPLFAPLIVGLDGKINLNVAGNVRGNNPKFLGKPDHVSNEGWGPWEISLKQVLLGDGTPPQYFDATEWTNLFDGKAIALASTKLRQIGRYGPAPSQPVSSSTGSVAPSSTSAHFYAQTDVDACNNAGGAPKGGPTSPLQLPTGANWSCFPTFPNGWLSGSQVERTNHAAIYNVFAPERNQTNPSQYNRRFPASELEKLLRYNDTGTEALTSQLMELCPKNFTNTTPPLDRIRRLVTTDSYDFDVPALSPWIWDPKAGNTYGMPLGSITAPTQNPPLSPPPSFPPLSKRQANPSAQGDFVRLDWRAISAALGRIDLNRPLTQYPLYDPPQLPDGQKPGVQTQGGTKPPSYTQVFRTNLPGIQNDPYYGSNFADAQTQFLQAQKDRQQLADDIYRRLLAVTQVPPVANPVAPTNQELMPRRWLAQLAVNIVDFIDEDDISTPFNFYNTTDTGGPPPQGGIGAFTSWSILPLPAPLNNATLGQVPKYWVFGTEVPKLVLNEVLAERHQPTPTTSNDPDQAMINVWIELLNTLELPPPGRQLQTQDGFPVVLRVGNGNNAYAPYQIVLATGLAPTNFNDNVLGAPDPNGIRAFTPPTASPTDVFGNTAKNVDGTPAQPSGLPGNPPVVWPHVEQATQPQGYFLLAPPFPSTVESDYIDPLKAPPAGSVPAKTPVLRNGSFQYKNLNTPLPTYHKVSKFELNTGTPQGSSFGSATGVTVLLRRLANPHLPYSGNPTDPFYNPYITIDYLEKVPVRWPAYTNPPLVASPGAYASRGKRQPYAAFLKPGLAAANGIYTTSTGTQVVDQQLNLPGQVKHTFGKKNASGVAGGDPTKFDWLVHLDRQVISPMELLHVSGFQPHQLTHQFITGVDSAITYTNKFQHYAPWFDERTRLYRIFDFLGTHSYAGGTGQSPGARWAGKVNLNDIWDVETLKALCDAQTPTSSFTTNHVQTIFNRLIQLRTPNGSPGNADRPFKGMATAYAAPTDPQYAPVGSGISDTLLRPAVVGGNQTTARLFQPALAANSPNNHPYLKYQLLTKLFNNLTTRSNVFAVWLTVGFFEVNKEDVVTDANGVQARRVYLGQEIGRAENRNVRHRMFAIVDRTALQPVFNTTGTAVFKTGTTNTWKVTPAKMTGQTADGYTWQITNGTVLTIGTGATQENVTVANPTATTFDVNFNSRHNSPFVIVGYGNPLPPSTPFNVHARPDLVPHFSIIE
jgi:hypothetical protein